MPMSCRTHERVEGNLQDVGNPFKLGDLERCLLSHPPGQCLLCQPGAFRNHPMREISPGDLGSDIRNYAMISRL